MHTLPSLTCIAANAAAGFSLTAADDGAAATALLPRPWSSPSSLLPPPASIFVHDACLEADAVGGTVSIAHAALPHRHNYVTVLQARSAATSPQFCILASGVSLVNSPETLH